MHAVALIPGFLGFDHARQSTYFADRFVVGLRAAVEAKVHRSVFVAPLAVPPIGSLAERQRKVIAELRRIEGTPGRRFTWHLVGHSAGGLDAAFLARTTKLVDGASGSEFGEAPPELRPASVTTIATPHYGSCIARASVSLATRPGATLEQRIAGLRAAPWLLYDLTQRDDLGARLDFALGTLSAGGLGFLGSLLWADRLLRDLDPEVASALTARTDNLGDAPIFSIATMAPPPAPPVEDRLFHHLWTWTQERAVGATPAPPPRVTAGVERIEARAGTLPDAFGPRDSDGVVNTDRQVFGVLTGLVSADHGDVMGRYRRTDPLDGSLVDPGLLTSGADFGDDQFFALLRLIARGIADSIESGRGGDRRTSRP